MTVSFITNESSKATINIVSVFSGIFCYQKVVVKPQSLNDFQNSVSKILKTIKLQKISKTLKLSARLLFPEVYGMPRSQNFPWVFLLSLPPRGVPWICWGPNCFFTPTSRKRSLVFCLNPDKNFLIRFFSTTNVLLF